MLGGTASDYHVVISVFDSITVYVRLYLVNRLPAELSLMVRSLLVWMRQYLFFFIRL